MATEEDNQHHDVVAIDLPAPEGWTKKFTPKKVGTPQRNDIVFISPTGEEIKSRKQLDQYLKSHPGGPAASEFEWGTGDTPRRSARLSEKSKAVVAPTSQSPKKKQKRSGTKQPQEKNNAGVVEEEATVEKDATAEETKETLESSTADAKETTDKDVIVPEKPNNEDVEMKPDAEETNKATTIEPEESKADEPKTESSEPSIKADEPKEESSEPSAKADEPKEETSEPSVKADEPTKESPKPEAKSEEAKEATNGGEEVPERKVDSAVTEGLENTKETEVAEEKAVEKEAEAASLQGPTTGS